jgi:hypothetical protein
MDSSDLIKFAPPILLGFGGVLPLLVTSAQQLVPTEARSICGIVFILLSWIGYWLIFMFWRLTLFDDWITLIFLLVTVICLTVTVAGACLTGTTITGWKRWLVPTAGNPLLGFFFYLTAIVSLSMAAAIYIAPSKWTIIDITIPTKPDGTIDNVKAVMTEDPNTAQTESFVNFVTRGHRVLVFVPADDIKKLKKVNVYRADIKNNPLPTTSIEERDFKPAISPSLGQKLTYSSQ